MRLLGDTGYGVAVLLSFIISMDAYHRYVPRTKRYQKCAANDCGGPPR
jgi:hypothetical protein